MAIIIPSWLIGKNVTGISMTGYVASISGNVTVLTADLTSILTGTLDDINVDQTNTLDLIVPLDIRADNEVIYGTGISCTLTEILSTISATNATPGNPVGNVLFTMAQAYDFVSVTFTFGGNVFSSFFVVGKYSPGFRRGKSTGSLDLRPCGATVT